MSICAKCIVPDSFPGVRFSDGICNFCIDQETIGLHPTTDKHHRLKEILTSPRISNEKGYDCLVPVSGGKDSAYVLYYIVKQLQLKPLAAFFDSDFTVDLARKNVETICTRLGVDWIVAKSRHNFRRKAVNEAIHMSRLMRRFWGICANCENNLRTMAINVAMDRGIPYIVWGSTDLEDADVAYDAGNRTRPTFRQFFGHKSVSVLESAFRKLFGTDSRLLYKGFHHLLKYSCYVIMDHFDMRMPGGLKKFNPLFQVPFEHSQLQVIYFYDYVNYNPSQQIATLKSELGWQAPSGREARMDCRLHCLQNYTHLNRSGLTGDGFYFANLVRNGLLTRSEALQKEQFLREGLRDECYETLKYLGFSKYDLESVPDLK